MPTPSPGDTTDPPAALEALAAALSKAHFATVLVTGPGRVPRLTVSSRYTGLAHDLCAHDGWYWWPTAERAAPVADVPAAAQAITQVLRASSGHLDG